MIKKAFFREATAAQIRNTYRTTKIISSDDYLNALVDLYEDQCFVIEGYLTPERFRTEPKKFKKHGNDVKLARFFSLADCAVNADIALRQAEAEYQYKGNPAVVLFRNKRLNNIADTPYSCYSFKPFSGTDKRTRRVRLVDCEDGTRLYAYPNKVHKIGNRPSIDIVDSPYVDSRRAGKDGGEVVVMVPSRTKGMRRYKIKYSSFPVVDVPEKWKVAYSLFTDHVCEEKRYDIRFTWEEGRESSRVFTFCPHEIAGYLYLVELFLHEYKNSIPLDMCQFAIPTQFTVDLADKMRFNALIKTPEDEKPRKLNKGEREVIHWKSVKEFGPWETFFAPFGQKVKDFRWRNLDDIITE